MTRPIRVLIVDDHSVVRQGLRAFLRLQDGIDVVGEAGGAAEAVAEAAASLPDVVLLDLVMPSGNGIGAIRGLLDAVPNARVVVLTSFADDAQIFAAMAAGAADTCSRTSIHKHWRSPFAMCTMGVPPCIRRWRLA